MARFTITRKRKEDKKLERMADEFYGPKMVAARMSGTKLEPYDTEKRIKYTQPSTNFDPKRMDKILNEFGVAKSKPVIGVAGFTGDMLRSMKKAGYNVRFSDVNPKWVEMAKKGEQLTKDGRIVKAERLVGFPLNVNRPHINDTKAGAFITFEMTPIYNPTRSVLQNLGTENGFIFVSKIGGMFDPLNSKWTGKKQNTLMKGLGEYKIQVSYKEDKENGISFVQFRIPKEFKKRYLIDRECYESVKLNRKSPALVAKRLGLPQKEVVQRARKYWRIIEDLPPS